MYFIDTSHAVPYCEYMGECVSLLLARMATLDQPYVTEERRYRAQCEFDKLLDLVRGCVASDIN